MSENRKLLDRLVLAAISLEQVRMEATEQGTAISYRELAESGRIFDELYKATLVVMDAE